MLERRAFWIFLLALSLNSFSITTTFAQRGGGQGGGRGGQGGPSGLRDLQGSRRQGPFADLPWDAQKLLESHQATFRRLPPPLRTYILQSVASWDHFFPIRQQQFEIFFRKAEQEERRDLTEAFRDAMPADLQVPPLSQGGSRQGRRGRGGNAPFQALTPEQLSKIDLAFQSYVLSEQATSPGIVLLALTGGSEPAIPQELLSQGTRLTKLSYPGPLAQWLAILQTGRADASKSKTLPDPSLFEYVNHIFDDKTHTRTLAFFQSDNPPAVQSKSKGYGKKYAPLIVSAKPLAPIAKTIEAELGEAIRQGKSERYIELMVKPKLSPDALKIDKIVKEKLLQHLVLQTLLNNEASRKSDAAFIHALTHDALTQALPDILLAQSDITSTTPDYISQMAQLIQTHPRYQNGGTLVILDQPHGQALLVGPKVKANHVIDTPQTLENLMVTLTKVAQIPSESAQGTPISELLALP